MFTLTETKPQIAIQEAEYVRLLGYPKNRTLEGRSRELADGAAKWFAENGRPWICACEVSPLELGAKKLRLSGVEFSSRRLREILNEAQAHSTVLVAVSAGPECEEHARQLWNDDKPDEYFFLESYGSAVVEQLVVLASGRLCAWADTQGMAALPHFSPGYSGWNIAEQGTLWNLFRQQFDRDLPGPLEVLESGMLRPKKSLLTVFGLTRDLDKARRFAKLIPCENCFLPDCQYRRAPFKRPMPRVESPAPADECP
jgi:hypothetical protein